MFLRMFGGGGGCLIGDVLDIRWAVVTELTCLIFCSNKSVNELFPAACDWFTEQDCFIYHILATFSRCEAVWKVGPPNALSNRCNEHAEAWRENNWVQNTRRRWKIWGWDRGASQGFRPWLDVQANSVPLSSHTTKNESWTHKGFLISVLCDAHCASVREANPLLKSVLSVSICGMPSTRLSIRRV